MGANFVLDTGSPPPARGAQGAQRPRLGPRRITPACAGSTGNWAHFSSSWLDHPRLRGEHLRPRWQGAPAPGITPACAGSTCRFESHGVLSRDHPRLRGEHVAPRQGLRLSLRITPACAGSTLLNQGCYVKERRISFTPSRSTGSHGPPVMRKSSPCSLRAA